jgi:recombination protein RecA
MASHAPSFGKFTHGEVGRGLEGFRSKVAVELQPCGVAELDAVLGGGFPRGSLVELCGSASSGRTSLALSLLAQTTAQQEACAFVDVSDSLDPMSLAAAGVDLPKVLWVRCGEAQGKAAVGESSAYFTATEKQAPGKTATYQPKGKPLQGAFWKHPREQVRGLERAIPSLLHGKTKNVESAQIHLVESPGKKESRPVRQEISLLENGAKEKAGASGLWHGALRAKPWKRLEQALKTTDLLLNSGGWGVVVVDLAGISWVDARRINLNVWFRFRRELENTKTILLLLGEESCAKSCASLVLRCERRAEHWSRAAQDCNSGVSILQGFEVQGEVQRSRNQSQPADCARWQTQVMTR